MQKPNRAKAITFFTLFVDNFLPHSHFRGFLPVLFVYGEAFYYNHSSLIFIRFLVAVAACYFYQGKNECEQEIALLVNYFYPNDTYNVHNLQYITHTYNSSNSVKEKR